MHITGTFLDEISHDIPHQNWGPAQWEADFRHMQAAGIDTVILIRGGYRRFLTWPSDYLVREQGCYQPGQDLVELFLTLAGRYGMTFYFGLYDSGRHWDSGNMQHEVDANRYVIDEVWQRYGHHAAFGGWYLSMEISRKTRGAIESFRTLGQHCKDISGGLPTLISPWIDGKKAVAATAATLTKDDTISLAAHEREWDEIFSGIHEVIDAVAFQDGHVDYHELDAFFSVNKQLADHYGLACWTNAETFDRDMPIKFLPIKFEKLRLKLEAAARAGYDKAITFEFSHFMSPQSMYPSAGNLLDRYREWANLPPTP
ncbi:DUF4434 domain-containing protein [Neolewinella sp.]|uniref:DUF4434 domain-containing protein n=1 Tax=Neolewinella sp. TaxID=2993543 RepID=UPI003B517F44